MEQDEPGHAEHSSEQTPDDNDPEGRVHQTSPGQEHSTDDDAFIITETCLERDNLHRRLMVTARSLKKQKQRLKAAQETLNRRWNKVLDTEERSGNDRHMKSYLKRKLLLEFDDEAVPPKSNTTGRQDVPLHNHNKATTEDAHDLREHLDKKVGAARSIYGSKGHTPTQNNGHQNNHTDRIPVRNQHWTQQ